MEHKRFVTKNQDHMEFFGGNLTGVHIVRFTPADMDRFFLDVLDIEEEEVKDSYDAFNSPDPKFLKSLPLIQQNQLFFVFSMFTIKFKKLIFWIMLSDKFYNFENEIKVSL